MRYTHAEAMPVTAAASKKRVRNLIKVVRSR